MTYTDIKKIIETAWASGDEISPNREEVCAAVMTALARLDAGEARVAEKQGEDWIVNEWLKMAVLLSFRLNPMRRIGGGPGGGGWWDKIASKFEDWREEDFKRAGFRAVPTAVVRRGAYVAPNAVLMPSFVNIGAYVGEGAMIDTWATVGSCAQVGANCHISGGAGIGGVLEPLQATPVIIEENCFIGARSEVAEGVIIRRGAVLAMGVYLSASTKIVDRATGEVRYGEVPPYAVVVPGALPDPQGGPSLYCAVIVKQVDEKTRAKTSVNDLLRG